MTRSTGLHGRRRFLQGLACGTAAVATPGAFAEALVRTPRQTEGPFYPDELPVDTDNDLLIVNDTITPAVGEVTYLTGRVLRASGEPVRNATVEIWQVDNNGIYLHTDSPRRDRRDSHFQGFGRFLTDSKGRYYFRTIKPVTYGTGFQRTPHIHFAIRRGEDRLLTTQMYIKGHPRNREDGIYQRLPTAEAREAVTIDFQPLDESAAGRWSAHFDIVLGRTPADS